MWVEKIGAGHYHIESANRTYFADIVQDRRHWQVTVADKATGFLREVGGTYPTLRQARQKAEAMIQELAVTR
jgi:hypothetical protein